MKKVEECYVLTREELSALVNACVDHATWMLHASDNVQADNPLPFYVDRAEQLLTGSRLFTDDELAGTLRADENGGKRIDNEELYRNLADAVSNGVWEVHGVYAPENNTAYPGWFSAAVDLFRPGNTYRVYFSHEGNNQIRIEHLEKWWFG